MELKRVVVTGLGAVTPVGNTPEETWKNLLEGKSGAAPITNFDTTNFKTKFACEVKGLKGNDNNDRKEARKMDRYCQLAMISAAQGIKDAGLDLEKEDFSKSKFYAKQALNEIRYMIGSGSIEFTEDFEKIIREICSAFEVNFGIKTNLYVASQKIVALKNTQKTHLIRILQEALSNISRHSDATQVEIKIVDGIDDFRFIICDNGKGFEETEVESKKLKAAVKHYGLTNIKKRAQLIDGSADFINEGGFTIAITVKDSVH